MRLICNAGRIICLCLLAGCSTLNKPLNAELGKSSGKNPLVMAEWILPEHVENWLEDQEYGLVLDWLDTIPHDYPGFGVVKKIHGEVKKRAKEYEKTVLLEVAKERKKGNLDGVFMILSTALRKLPNSAALLRKRNTLFTKQIRQINFLNRELLIARGRYLVSEVITREQLAQIDWDNPSARWNLRRLREELKTTSHELVRCGKRAMNEGFLEQSRFCLQLAGKMHKSKEQIAISRQLNKSLLRKRKREQLRQLKKDKIQQQVSMKISASELQELAKKALTQGRLRMALEVLEELAVIDRNDKQVLQLKKAVEKKLVARVAALMKRGNSFYKNGSIEDAKRDWEEVLRLDPNNKEARNNADRAERVLEKLLELQTDGS